MLNHQEHIATRNVTPFELQSGAALLEMQVAYHTYGELNEDQSNVILILHALTGTPAAHQWWSGLLGEGKLLDTSKYYIVCPNLLGSCYGTTGPDAVEPRRGAPYHASFPEITVRDIARSCLWLLDEIGISEVALAIGGSMGGMVLLEMAAEQPDRFHSLIPIAVSGTHSAWRLAFSTTIRKAVIAHDPTLLDRAKLQQGLRLARQFAMTSYRCANEFDSRFGRGRVRSKFEIENYLEHHGDTIVERFSPYSYLTLTRAMEWYDLAEGRGKQRHGEHSVGATHPGGIEQVAAGIRCPVLCIGISSDILYPPGEIAHFASFFPDGHYLTLNAAHGHDSFLVDIDILHSLLAPFLLDYISSRLPIHCFA